MDQAKILRELGPPTYMNPFAIWNINHPEETLRSELSANASRQLDAVAAFLKEGIPVKLEL